MQSLSGTVSVVAELPVNQGAGLVGSDIETIGEITPTALQANAWIDDVESATPASLTADAGYTTLEAYFYAHAVASDNVNVTDILRDVNGANIACKRIELTLGVGSNFYSNGDGLNLADIVPPKNMGS
jgi:hypothetical protein